MNVFISYRREDTKWPAKLLYSTLSQRLGDQQVFLDIYSTPIGLDFREEISEWISQSDIFLALIGSRWLTASEESEQTPRLQSPNDLVRIEIESALETGIPVVPVFVDGVGIPDQSRLPDSLKELFARNGAILDYRTFETDVEKIMAAMSRVLARTEVDQSQPTVTTVDSANHLTQTGEAAVSDQAILVLTFLERWKTWGFTPKRVVNWGGTQTGFEPLSRLSRGQVERILESLVSQGKAKTRLSRSGNTLYQFDQN